MPKKNRDYKQERKTAIARGETGVGSDSGDATRHRARRKVQKKLKRKLSPDEHVDHATPIKEGGGNGESNLRVRKKLKNSSDGGKIGNKAGKAAGGRKSKK